MDKPSKNKNFIIVKDEIDQKGGFIPHRVISLAPFVLGPPFIKPGHLRSSLVSSPLVPSPLMPPRPLWGRYSAHPDMPVTAVVRTPKGPVRVRGRKADVDKYVADMEKKTGTPTGPSYAPVITGPTGPRGAPTGSPGTSTTGSTLAANGAGVIIVASIQERDSMERKANAVLLFKYKGESSFRDIGQDSDSLSTNDMIIAAKQGARLGSRNMLNFDSYNIEKTRRDDITYVDYKASGFTHRTFFVGVGTNVILHHYFFANRKIMEFVMDPRWDQCEEMKWFTMEELDKCTGTGDVTCKDIDGNTNTINERTIKSIRSAKSSSILSSVAKTPSFTSTGYDKGYGDYRVRGTNTIIFSNN